MDGFDQWHAMYKAKLVIPSTQNDNLAATQLFLCECAVRVKPNSVVYH